MAGGYGFSRTKTRKKIRISNRGPKKKQVKVILIDKYPLLEKECNFCESEFVTRDPRKKFCRVQCRVEHWQRRHA